MLISTIMSQLIQSYCIDSRTFKCILAILNILDYETLLRERYINHRCGYPLCSKIITNNSCTNNLSYYCDDYHFDCSQFVLTQMGQYPRCNVEQWKRLLTQGEDNPARLILFDELLQDKVVERDIDSLTTDMNIFRLM
ncbi:hypothetical protein C6P45_005505 [Maudiozyma exigua]|uniref:RTR1-type domain-containing protein n=1 Tax=Maudiozyma exigua TaxID=34358 RepID=A0A9P6W8G2_MAUEX|nr:hypothetical protein C6P45_005505 [Kazachstania exigua]